MDSRYGSRDNSIGGMPIRETPFFQGLPDDIIDQATAQVVTRRHPANQVLLLENDWGSTV